MLIKIPFDLIPHMIFWDFFTALTLQIFPSYHFSISEAINLKNSMVLYGKRVDKRAMVYEHLFNTFKSYRE